MANPHGITIITLHQCVVDYAGSPAAPVREKGVSVYLCLAAPQLLVVTDDGGPAGTVVAYGTQAIGKFYETGAAIVAMLTA